MSDAAELSEDTFRLFRYDPSLAAAVIFTFLFGVSSVHHTWLLAATRTWFFIAFAVGCWFEFIGFITRAIAAQESPNWTVSVYSVHTILVLVAPSLMAASIYMCLGRIIVVTQGEKYSLVPTRWLTKIFVIGDVFAFLFQGAGGGIMASGSLSAVHTGEKIIILGLVIQILFFSGFVVVSALFHYRIWRMPTARSLDPDSSWRSSLWSLYFGSILIWVRCVFRLAEYAQGNSGYLISHEAYLYIFDALLIFGVAVIFALVHPSNIAAEIRGPGAKVVEKGIFIRSTLSRHYHAPG